MTEIRYSTRNEAIEFSRRTKINLEFIEQAKDRGERVHEVTQLALSLLGLIVFPKEQLLLDEIDRISLDDLIAQGWPKWQITLDSGREPTKTLGRLVWHLRNAISHRGLKFTSDDEYLENVAIQVEDRPGKGAEPNWRAEISGNDLRDFCFRFADLVDRIVG
ncbi:MAG: HEPN family nuclease [Bryobacteraceae bacterium]|jgi:HEPN pEK499 p136